MKARLVRKHFVQFLYSGSFFSEDSSKEVAERNPSKVEVPQGAFCFSFYDQIVGVAIENGKEIPVSSGMLDKSSNYYYGGKVYTVARLKKEFPNDKTLISNIEGNGYKRAIRCRTGNWQPFENGDVFIEEKVA
ncbi:MAG: hypothetical protein A2534_00145 [Candidatus Magasanikbacteria bacterium RIFOXYD2_FULL_39_9]|uniref:Uncharacterized protein n=1 Tax=Candidatus Magasanikbacteria bacterium RIFOXYD1_FULL_40_23 TaxID=1798705 RepID=A0A1F6P9I3_9BACT|nr:MAG: hypothetical protein A2563_02965 [Candidatus Magasanikbacteria bacterium RIFOXYD1_FULL_40_23]OGH93555.1 MAG: hypothetical protein A2534_00145 [Candidatus Magasanikbacteria bacterium RIFOXYD2_FULL_39_9]